MLNQNKPNKSNKDIGNKRNIKIFKTILAIAVIIEMLILLWLSLPLFKELSTIEGQIEFKQQMENSKLLGFLILFGLQFLQIFIFFMPGEPIEIMAGICFGKFLGTVFIALTAFLVSLIIFACVKRFGRKFIYDFSDEKKIKKIENSKLFKNTKAIEAIMVIMFFVPGLPKDILIFVAGLLPIKRPVLFMVMLTIARMPSIVSSTFCGESILAGDFRMAIIIYGVIVLLAALIAVIIISFDKSNNIKEFIKLCTSKNEKEDNKKE